MAAPTRQGTARALCLLAALLAACFPLGAVAKVTTGVVANEKWAYLGKFCFAYSPTNTAPWGYVNVSVSTAQDDVVLFFYDDQSWSWPMVEDPALTCLEKTNRSRVNPIDGAVPVTTTNGWTMQYFVREHLEPRFWYIAAATADCQYDVNIESFTLTFINPGPPPTQFGVDEFGLPTMYIVFGLMYLVGLLVHVYFHRRRQFFPLPVKLFTWSLTATTTAMFCLGLHWSTYGSNGVGMPFFEGVGRFLSIISVLLLWAMAALVSSGHGITQAAYSTSRNCGAIVLLAATVTGYFALFIWYEAGREPWSNDYLYDSGFGMVVVFLTVMYALWWAWKLRNLYVEDPSPVRKSFYRRFAVSAGLLFVIMPIVVIVGNAVPAIERRRVVYSLLNALQLGTTVGLAYTLFPSNAQKVFMAYAGLGLGVGLGGEPTPMHMSLDPLDMPETEDGDPAATPYAAL